jgi:hypothetical protein
MPIDEKYIAKKGIRTGDPIEIVLSRGSSVLGFFASISDGWLRFNSGNYRTDVIDEVYLLKRKK